jgi:catechol 2,3-dioxygenase-like lactoylglutathione lyase family enzyme
MKRVALGAVAHFSLAVSDPALSADWWTSHFDLEEYGRTEHRVVLGNDSVLFALFKGRPDATVLEHVAFRAGDIASLRSARDALRDVGVALEDPGDEIGPVSPGASSLGLWFRDVDGYRWELYVQVKDDE